MVFLNAEHLPVLCRVCCLDFDVSETICCQNIVFNVRSRLLTLSVYEQTEKNNIRSRGSSRPVTFINATFNVYGRKPEGVRPSDFGPIFKIVREQVDENRPL